MCPNTFSPLSSGKNSAVCERKKQQFKQYTFHRLRELKNHSTVKGLVLSVRMWTSRDGVTSLAKSVVMNRRCAYDRLCGAVLHQLSEGCKPRTCTSNISTSNIISSSIKTSINESIRFYHKITRVGFLLAKSGKNRKLLSCLVRRFAGVN